MPPAAAQQPAAGPITVTVLEGEGAINNVRRRAAQNLTAQVTTEDGKPVRGASVVFNLPSQGASGTFSDGGITLMLTTDAQGRAVARGFRPNSAAGKFEIHVTASHAGQTARATITQFNMDVRNDSGGGGGKIAAVVVLLGAAAAAGAVVAYRRQNTAGPTPTPPITLTPGSGTVAPPQ